METEIEEEGEREGGTKGGKRGRRKGGRREGSMIHPQGLVLKWLQWPGLVQAEARTKTLS